MSEYALLLLPSANRVYSDSAVELTLAELAAFGPVLTAPLAELAPAEIAGVPYVRFSSSLGPDDLRYLANASAAYALFELLPDGLLRPIPLTPLDRFDDDLITIPKYAGKTNEQFTKLLLNVTLLARSAPADMLGRLRVLDPLCGRGTTLNQALMYGYDAAGIDLDGKDYEAYAAFVPTYLKRKRIKHKSEAGPVRRERKVVARRLRVALIAPCGGDALNLDVVCADTTSAGQFFKPASFDAIVTDAPYGVQHGGRTVASGLRRSPLDLLAAAVPVWAELLRPGAAIGIAINTLVSRHADVAALLDEAGLNVRSDGPYAAFAHRVDQAITRDIVVARKP
jgi:SAM-dependent methyltransferase